MGQFAGSLFKMLLGWVQTAASWLWNAITNPGGESPLQWLTDNWLTLVILLCAAGVLIDLVVYIFRWQPYRVWRRILQRLKRKDEPEEEPERPPLAFQRKWLYADGSTAVEDIHEEPREPMVPVNDQLDAPIRPRRRVARHMPEENAYNQPVYPPQWQHNQQGDNE